MITYPTTIEQLFGQIMSSSAVTYSDRKVINNALLDGRLTKTEQAIINRILYSVRRGFVRLLD